jgi:hypothetical protein
MFSAVAWREIEKMPGLQARGPAGVWMDYLASEGPERSTDASLVLHR